MTKVELLERLHRLMSEAHAPFGQAAGLLTPEQAANAIAMPCGETGVIAFIGEYVLTGWEDHDIRAASRDAYRHLGQWLRVHPYTRHMVYPLNFRSVRLTRKLGAKPIGVDADGWVHYVLTREDFTAARRSRRSRHGQEISTA